MPSIKRGLRAAVLLAPFFLAACAIPRYQPGASEPAAHVRLMGLGKLSMCQEHREYLLPVQEDAKGTRWTYLPAGERITLISYNTETVYLPGGNGPSTISCTARASVVPRQGINLIVNSNTPGFNSCGLEIVREDESTETGLSIEPSVQAVPRPNVKPGLNAMLEPPSC